MTPRISRLPSLPSTSRSTAKVTATENADFPSPSPSPPTSIRQPRARSTPIAALIAVAVQALYAPAQAQAAPVGVTTIPDAGVLLNSLDQRQSPTVTGSGNPSFSSLPKKTDHAADVKDGANNSDNSDNSNDTNRTNGTNSPNDTKTGPVPAAITGKATTATGNAAAPAALTVILKNVSLQGNHVIPGERLRACAIPFLGKPVALKDLTQLAASMTQVYRDSGYLLAQVFMPPQDITSGHVQFDVVEGNVASIKIDAASGTPLRAALMRAWLHALPVGAPLQQDALETTMLHLADLPGVQVSAAIEPARQLGEVDLLVSAEPARRWSFAVTGDNYGTPAVGTNRVSAIGRLNSPFLLGDNLDITLLGGQRLDTAYGRIAYEAPIDHNGTRAGMAYSHLNYALGTPYRALDAFGDAETLETYVSRALLRSRSANVLGRVGLSYRRLRDNLAAFGLYDRQSLYVADASLSYEGRDNFLFGGFSTASVKLSVARLNIDSVTDRLLDNIAEGGRDTLGNSVRMTVSANRLVPLAGNNTQSALFAGVSAQWANRNLDNASRITLGGPQGVRAYAPSEAVVDAGGVGTIEYRVGLSRWVAAVLPSRYSGFASNVTGAVFFDYGIGRYNIHATPAQTRGQSASTVVRSGAGVGLTWSLAPKITINTTVAWRTTGTDSTGNDRVPRFYAQFTKVF